jgi:hypothetical protein
MQGVKKVFGIGEEQKELVDPYFVFSFAGKEVGIQSGFTVNVQEKSKLYNRYFYVCFVDIL